MTAPDGRPASGAAFSFTTEQDDLRELVRDVLTKQPLRSREPGSYDTTLWRRLCTELGLTGLALPSAVGGADASLVDLAVVLEETGRALLALPYLSTVVGGALLPPSLQSSVAAGETIVALALRPGLRFSRGTVSGPATGVMDGDVASVAVVVASGALYAVPLAEVSRTPSSTLDHSRPAATLLFDAAPATPLAASPESALDALHLALAVESLGVANASLSATAQYLKTRHQFGAPLASFQALRHRLADLAVAIEAAASTTWYAVRADALERPVVAPMAKLVAADAAYVVTAESIQLHGGIGFTWEHDAHRYFKRATVTRLTHGDPVTLRRLLADRAAVLGGSATDLDRAPHH
jgi:alkylation response protein AidB-like acyl-CoA dehydrogenase